MDFFKPIVKPEEFSPNFADVLKASNHYDQALFAKWAEGFVDRDGDGKFVKEFQTTFNSSFWEIYLYAALKHLGCTVDFDHHAPDFVVTGPTAFCMEATVASNAKGALPEHTPIRKAPFPWDLNEFNRSAVVRLLNSISEKSKKYLKSYQKLPHTQNKPFVIAVAPFDQPYFYLQTHRAIDATLFGYYVDEQEFLENPSLDQPMPVYKIGGVYKNPETQLPVGLFHDPAYAHISAVVFNSCATWGKIRCLSGDPNPTIYVTATRADPRDGHISKFDCPKWSRARFKESLLDGLRVYHNPYATHPLDWGVFRSPEVFQGKMTSVDKPEWEFEVGRPTLASRSVKTFRMVRGAAEPQSKEKADTKEARKRKRDERARKKKGRR